MIGRIKSRKVEGTAPSATEGRARGAPERVARYASKLGLGALQGESGGGRFEYARGTIALSAQTGRITEVRLAGPDGQPEKVPLLAAKAAVRLSLGSYRRTVSAAGSRFWEFARGTVRWSAVEDRLSSVRIQGLWLPSAVVTAAVKHRLGAFAGEEPSGQRTRYTFARGAVEAQRRSGEVLSVVERARPSKS